MLEEVNVTVIPMLGVICKSRKSSIKTMRAQTLLLIQVVFPSLFFFFLFIYLFIFNFILFLNFT